MFQFRRFPSCAYLIQRRLTEYCSAGFPHSEICGSKLMCSSPQLIAACHVLHRLLMPRHSPCALSSLTYGLLLTSSQNYASNLRSSVEIVIVTLYFKVPQFLFRYLPLCCLAFICYHFIQFSRCKKEGTLESIPSKLNNVSEKV